METLSAYQDALAKAETLSPEDLTRLIGELSKLLREKYSKWDMLKDVEDVRAYVEWMRFRDSHYGDGQQKNPQDFLTELDEDE
jgi:argininosuccinate lyase